MLIRFGHKNLYKIWRKGLQNICDGKELFPKRVSKLEHLIVTFYFFSMYPDFSSWARVNLAWVGDANSCRYTNIQYNSSESEEQQGGGGAGRGRGRERGTIFAVSSLYENLHHTPKLFGFWKSIYVNKKLLYQCTEKFKVFKAIFTNHIGVLRTVLPIKEHQVHLMELNKKDRVLFLRNYTLNC